MHGLLPPATLAAETSLTWVAALAFLIETVLRLGTAVRIVMRRMSVEAALTWLVVVLLLPFVGVGLYWAFSEIRVGRKRAKRFLNVHRSYTDYLANLRRAAPAAQLDPRFAALARQAEHVSDCPALPGNALTLLPSTTAALREIAAAIDDAQRYVEMLYFIFLDGPHSEPVFEALVRAARRGVRCRLLVDAMGSRAFLGSPWDQRLRDAGVQINAALPARPLRVLIQRIDLRNHRKLTLIDGHTAYTGSMNLMGPRRLHAARGVGPWIDVVVKVQGPAVAPLYAMFAEDWEAETDQTPDDLETRTDAALHGKQPGHAWVQVVPSGPNLDGHSVRDLVLTSIYAARQTLTLTTPYFAPDDALLTALTSAATRGVEVTLILPQRVDSKLAHHAGNAHVQQLLEAGVRVARFRGGVLHTKSLTIDHDATLLGTVNLDMRSFYLNFEMSLWIYDAEFTQQMHAVHQSYLDNAFLTDPQAWAQRPWRHQLLERTLRLAGPLL